MELNQKQKDAVREVLDGKLSTSNLSDCEMCGNESWAIDPYIMELRQFNKGGFDSRAIIPLVCMHCTKCGNTKMFNAISLGVVNEETGEIIDRIPEVVGG